MLSNPAIVYSIVWLLAMFLYLLRWSDIFLTLSELTIFYILGSVLIVMFTWMISALMYKQPSIIFDRLSNQFSNLANKKIKLFLYIWIIGTIIEVIYFHDLPILSVFGLSSMTYADFGLPSLHGFLNAIILSLSMYLMYKYIQMNKKTYLYYYLLTLLVPIFGMNRGMLTSMLIESLFVIIVFKGIKFNTFVKTLVFLIFFFFLFGKMGELRYNGNTNDLYAAFQISDNFPAFLPRSFIWIYMYITSSLNNIENILSSFPDFNFEPYKAIFGLIPSIIRNFLDAPITQTLVVPAFNVSSYMPNYLSAFGLYGSLYFYFLASMVGMYIYYKYKYNNKLSYGFTLVILLHSIALSVFSDFFAIQVYLFQIIIQIIIFNNIIIKNKKGEIKNVQK